MPTSYACGPPLGTTIKENNDPHIILRREMYYMFYQMGVFFERSLLSFTVFPLKVGPTANVVINNCFREQMIRAIRLEDSYFPA